MASCSSFVSEEEVLCSICLEVFTAPVSIPCGHNFCKVCISNYWDTTNVCQCPLCKENFYRRPELRVNTAFRDVVERFKKMMVGDEERSPARPGDVSCDVCTGRKLKATKSCLVCRCSYCEIHLEPHLRVTAFKKHNLILPVENLEDRMCKKHDKLLERFCRTDQTCVCQCCAEGDHKTHNTVPLEAECSERKTQMKRADREVQQLIQERLKKVQEIKLSVETSNREAEREISDSLEVFTALMSSIQRSQAENIQVIEDKQNATKKRAEGFIKELEQEITKLKRRSSELEQLSHSEDHLHLLQSFTSLSTPPHTKDWSQVSVDSYPSLMGTLVSTLSQLKDTLIKDINNKFAEAELKFIQWYAVDVTLDPDTAYSTLTLSADGKEVGDGGTLKSLLRFLHPDHPKKFDTYPMVLGKQSFSSGRFYYEVQVEGTTQWDLGVARESINRKGQITLSPENGFWIICLRNGETYHASGAAVLSLREKPQKVGVFVDYEKGLVVFYNVKTKSHIYSFTGCTFTEKLYPFLGPYSKSGHLIITPVTHTA